MKLKKLFDRWGHKADKDYADKQWLLSKWEVHEGVEWPREKTEILIRSLKSGLKPQQNDRFIELGCAGGWLLESLRPAVSQYYGLDFSFEMLSFASQDLQEGHLVCGEIGKLPFKNESFDCVLSYYVFMNFDDDQYVQTSLKEIYRILKKGGRALIGQFPARDGSARYERAKEEYFQYCRETFNVGKSIREEFKPPLRLFDKKKLSSFLQQEGISHSYQDSFNPFFYQGESETIDWRFDLIVTKP